MKKAFLFLLSLFAVFGSQAQSVVTIETDVTSQFASLTQASKWTTGSGGTAGYTATIFCPTVTTNAGQSVQVCEFYEADCSRTGDMLYQTVTGLTPGLYQIELYGAAAYTFGRGFTSEAFAEGTWSAGDHIDENTGVTLYAVTSEGEYGGEIPIYYATDFPDGAATVTLDDVVVGENGEMKIGMSKTSQSTNWHVIQLKGVTVKAVASDLLAASVAAAEAALTDNLPAGVAEALSALIAANKEAAYETADEYVEAIEALRAATSKAEACTLAAEKLAAMKQLVESTNIYTEEAYTAYYGKWAEAYENGTITIAEASELQNPYAITAWHASITVDDLLLSAWDTNPDFVDAPYYINTWSTEGESDGTEFKVPFFEYWTGDDSSLGEKTLTATMSGLQPGVYNVSAWVRVRAKNGTDAAEAYGITLLANGGEAVDVTEGETNGQFNLAEYTAQGVVGEDGELKIQFVVAADNNISWLSFQNVKCAAVDPYEEALKTIQDGQTYRVFTENGDGQKFYLNASGYLVADAKKAATFAFKAVKADGTLYETGWNLGCKFTNPSLTDGSTGDVVQNGHINVGGNDRNDWERQVFFMNAEGKYAVRATNANSANWGANTYWTVTDIEAELPKADYQLTSSYVWQIEENVDNRPEAWAKTQTWAAQLQAVEGLVQDAAMYTSNAKESREGSYAALLDNDYASFFHSSWCAGADDTHYLQAELPEAAQSFCIYFKKRSQNNNNRPTNIVVEGSNDGESFVNITTISEGLPTGATPIDYTSAQINGNEAYKYLRFTVTATNNGATEGNGHVFFTFSEFYILPGDGLIAEAAPFMVGDYTDLDDADVETINAIDEKIKAAKAQVDLAADIADLKALAEKLKAQVDATDTYEDTGNVVDQVNEAIDGVLNGTYTTEDDIELANVQIRIAAAGFFTTITPKADIDITDWFIQNPSPIASNAMADGWEGTNFGDASNGVSEYWNKSAAEFHQAVTLPAGNFKLTAIALTRTDMEGVIYAGENSVNIVTVGNDIVNSRADAAAWFAEGNGVNEIDFTMAEAGKIEIGLKADANTGDHWTVWQSFKLEMVPAAGPAGIELADIDALKKLTLEADPDDPYNDPSADVVLTLTDAKVTYVGTSSGYDADWNLVEFENVVIEDASGATLLQGLDLGVKAGDVINGKLAFNATVSMGEKVLARNDATAESIAALEITDGTAEPLVLNDDNVMDWSEDPFWRYIKLEDAELKVESGDYGDDLQVYSDVIGNAYGIEDLFGVLSQDAEYNDGDKAVVTGFVASFFGGLITGFIPTEIVVLQKGDVNVDGDVDVADHAVIREHILAQGEYVAAYDINEDQSVDVADLAGLVNIILYGNWQGEEADGGVRSLNATANELTLNAVGAGRYALTLNANSEFNGFQMDIIVPEGMTLVSSEVNSGSHTVLTSQLANGMTRVLVFSTDNAAFASNELLYLNVTGQGTLKAENIVFADMHANAVTMELGQATGINGVNADADSTIYDLGGRKSNTMRRGVNIVRTADGATKKVLK